MTAPRLASYLAAGIAGFTLIGPARRGPQLPAYEVWAADQNGNQIFVLGPEGNVLRTIDSAALGNARRPHMLWGVPGDPYVYSANTVSNSVTVLDRRDARTLAVIPSVGKLPHAAQPHPGRPDRIYVMNIGPQARGADGAPDNGETITEVVRRSGPQGPSWEITRFLDLRASPALADSTRFPSRRPVCGGFSRDGRSMLVTMFNGGLAIVNLERWEVSGALGRDQIAEHGCGFATSRDRREMYVTSGGMHASWLYVFDVSGSEPRLVRSHDLSAVGQDAHGVYVDPRRNELWIVHRVSNNITIHPLGTIRRADHRWATIPFVGRAPDLIAFSPDARRAYVTLRGPRPAPTIPHATVGERPGVTIIDVPGRRVLSTVHLADPELGDFHGIFIPSGAP